MMKLVKHPPLTWRQELLLCAAADVDILPSPEWHGGNPGYIPHGVYRSLDIRGLLRSTPSGYELTDDGRAAAANIKGGRQRMALVAQRERQEARPSVERRISEREFLVAWRRAG